MELEEIEDRVRQALEALNRDEELYDWRLTFYNSQAWADLQEGCYHLSKEIISETTLRGQIKAFRDRSRMSHIDFRIKVPEPSPEDFGRLDVLFGPLDPARRLVPPRTPEERKAYLQGKILSAMRLGMENKQVLSGKILQQFNWLMIREKNKTPEMLAVHLNMENYNPYQKKLSPEPTVELNPHLGIQAEQAPAPVVAPEPMFGSAEVDNSSFEARLARDQVKAVRSVKAPRTPRPEQIIAAVMEPEAPATPHELPSVIHEEFATYCQNLYERRNA